MSKNDQKPDPIRPFIESMNIDDFQGKSPLPEPLGTKHEECSHLGLQGLKKELARVEELRKKRGLPDDDKAKYMLASIMATETDVRSTLELSENDRLYLEAYLKDHLPNDLLPELKMEIARIMRTYGWKCYLIGAAHLQWLGARECDDCQGDDDEGEEE